MPDLSLIWILSKKPQAVADMLCSETQPFIHKDPHLQVRGVWHAVAAHWADWMYFTFTEACPGSDSPKGVVSADAWSPGFYPWDYQQTDVLQWLAIARADGVPRGNLWVFCLRSIFLLGRGLWLMNMLIQGPSYSWTAD